MADTTKDTIYIDVDDEITTVIDKVMASSHKVVALVLPKRAAVFQSVVNMKLLKRKVDQASKNLVLITTESSLLPLAGSVGLHVAKTLASKPEIPLAPVIADSLIEAGEDDPIQLGDEEQPEIDLKDAAEKPVGELAEEPKSSSKLDKDMETIELDNAAVDADQAEKSADGKTTPLKKDKKGKKDKKLKVPNFERFRLWFILGGIVLVLLIILIWASASVFPSATIDINTDAANVNTNVPFTMSTTATTVNVASKTVPAKNVTETKTYTGTSNATGQQNNGQKANGSITLVNCSNSVAPVTVPAGTGISGSNSLTYITQNTVTLPPATFFGNNHCTQNSTTNVTVGAQNGGSNYNVNNATFTVSGYSGVTGSGSISGGTDDNVTIVSQSDITSAENKVATNTPGAKQDLTNQLNQANYYPIDTSFAAAAPNITPNASVGTAASSVTVTETIAYSMYGVKYASLQTLVNANITSQVSSNQSILDNGLSKATYSYTNGASNPTNITVQTTAEVGPDINVGVIKAQAAGKKTADIKSMVGNTPHVTSVTVHLSPFYVTTAPNNLSKIKVNITKPTKTSSNASSQ